MPRPSHHPGALLLLPLVLLLAACSAGPSSRPAVAYDEGPQPIPAAPPAPKPAPVPPLGGPAQNTLSWQDCTERTRVELGGPAGQQSFGGQSFGGRFSCTTLLTDLRSPEPSGMDVSQVSLLAAGTGQVPLVVLNDAAGEPGTTAAARLAGQLPPEMLRTFKIIGMDRRGTGASDPADCVPPGQRRVLAGFAPPPGDRAATGGLLDAARVAGQRCLLGLDERSQAYDSWRAAGDLEELRARLGVPKLHALGRGEAARVLTTYAERFPRSVGRTVLDGAPDPQQDAIGRAEARARGAEQVFDAFAAECSGDDGCPLGPDVRKSVGDVVDDARRAPLPAGRAPVSAGEVVQAVLTGLQDRHAWPELARALQAAERGDGTALGALAAPTTSGTGGASPRLDGALVTGCNDTAVRLPPQRGAEIVGEWTSRYPLFGGKQAQELLRCTGWPLPQETPPPPGNPGLPPIPVVTTAHDPLTPARGSDNTARQLPSGSSITWQGTGHGAVGRSECVTSAVSRFFVHGSVPTRGTACPA